MIDTATETILNFAEAAKLLSKLKKTKTHPKTAQLWALRGSGPSRVLLESAKIGRARITSAEACHRFVAACTAAAVTPVVPPSHAGSHASPRSRRSAKHHEQTKAALKRRGLM